MVTRAAKSSFPCKTFVVDKKIIVVTGASDGIGAAAARSLVDLGHRVVVVGRSPKKTELVAADIGMPFYLADFKRLDDVRSLASQLKRDFPRIDVLANNAGGIMGPRELTVDGNETTIQVNHLAPFLLTNLLLDVLIASRARVINTSSGAHKSAGKLDLDDLTPSRRHTPGRAYATAKLLNILFTKELQVRFGPDGVRAAAFHPGVVNTNFSSEYGGLINLGFTSVARHFFRSPETGADTLIWLATTNDWQPGLYYKDRKVVRTSTQANDLQLADRLWECSVSLTK
jgi:NAD(P)-dependent dehydrogenase (short-subunit alcohol dehydrogenase family)